MLPKHFGGAAQMYEERVVSVRHLTISSVVPFFQTFSVGNCSCYHSKLCVGQWISMKWTIRVIRLKGRSRNAAMIPLLVVCLCCIVCVACCSSNNLPCSTSWLQL